MRIAVLNCQTPFVTGGAELHAANLIKELKIRGHEADLVTLPFKWYPADCLSDAILAAQALDISQSSGNCFAAITARSIAITLSTSAAP